MAKVSFIVLICLVLFASASQTSASSAAMPLRPDIVEKLRAEGKLGEERVFMEEALRRGFNNIPDNEVYRVESGAQIMMISRPAIVILVDFSDNVVDTVASPRSHYQDLLFSLGTYATGSMRDYYRENSYGNFDVTGQATGWYRMPQTYAYYVDGLRGFGAYPHNAKKLVEDALVAADPYIDFSLFDNDGPDGIPDSGDDDGYVDALFVVHAGPGYETTGDPNDIHSHASRISAPMSLDGVLAYRYSIEPEDGKVGVFCHEFGHVLGLPDLYDYGYDSEGVGKWSLMASGSWCGGGVTPSHIDAWGKSKLGYLVLTVPTANLINQEIPRVEDNPVAYKIWTNGTPSNEYFVAEHRRKIKFDFNLPSKGLVIYHVDENMTNNDNQRCGPGTPHFRVAVEQADGECDLENNANQGDAGDPYPGSGGLYNPNTVLNEISTPNSKSYADAATGVAIYNIYFTEGMGYASFAVNLVPPTVTLSNNNGGAVLTVGEPDTIRWVAFDDIAVDSINILVSRDGGATYPDLIAHGEANDSSFVWTVTGPTSAQCRVKVVAYDATGYNAFDASDADFEVYDPAGVPAVTESAFRIVSVEPNPTSAGTRIVFSAPEGQASAAVYDVAGRLVRTLPVLRIDSGQAQYEAFWDGLTAGGAVSAPGVYFARVTSRAKTETAVVTIAR